MLVRLPLRLSLLLGLAMFASLLLGYRTLSPVDLLGWDQDPLLRHLLLEYRLPRMLIAPLCGAALAVSGCLLQSLTRNPLAAPDVLGVNAAASFSVVLALFWVPDLGLGWLNLLALVAVLAMTQLLLGLLRRGDPRQSLLRLPLLGSVLAMLFAALTQTLITLDPATQDQALSWLTGNIAGRSLTQLLVLSGLEDKPTSLFASTLLRARLGQAMAEQTNNDAINAESQFTAGLLSTLDAYLDMELDDILKDLPLSPAMKDAILHRAGTSGLLLDAAVAFDQAALDRIDWSQLSGLGIASSTARDLYIDSLRWASEVMRTLK